MRSSESVTCASGHRVFNGGADLAEAEWEVFMCYRGLRELSGQIYHRLPAHMKDQLRDAGLCHYMAIVRSPQGQLVQFDFGPRGKDVEWRPAGNNSASSASISPSSSIPSASSFASSSPTSASGGSQSPEMRSSMANVGFGRGGCEPAAAAGATGGDCGGWADPSLASRLASLQGLHGLHGLEESLHCLATGALLNHAPTGGYTAGACSGMASLTLQQTDMPPLVDYPMPPNGEIREELLSALPATAVRIGSTRMSIVDMRQFNATLDDNYLLNRNDCRHFVDAFVHHTTGLDRASARFIRANVSCEMRARPWRPSDPAVVLLQRALEKDNTYRVFAACHAAVTSLSSALLLRVGVRSGRLHQRIARALHSSAMAAIRRALPNATGVAAAAAAGAAAAAPLSPFSPISLISAAVAAGAVAAAAAVTAAGMRVRGIASAQLKLLVGLPLQQRRRREQQKQQQQAVLGSGVQAPAAAAPVAAAVAAAVPAGVIADVAIAASVQQSLQLQGSALAAGQQASVLGSTPQQATVQGQQKQQVLAANQQKHQHQQQVKAALWPSATRKSARRVHQNSCSSRSEVAGKAAIAAKARRGSTASKSSKRMNGAVSSSGGKGTRGLPAVVAHLSPISALVVAKASALGNGLKACLASRPLLSCDDALQLAA